MSRYDDEEIWTRPEGYLNAHAPRFNNPVSVPITRASEENLVPFGRIVRDFDQEEVWLESWPQTGRRRIIEGTGCGAGTLNEEFRVFWDGDLARVEEIPPDPLEELVAGRLPHEMPHDCRSHVLVRDFTSHPDGGQVFYPKEAKPFIQVLGPVGDELIPSDMVAFYFDGGYGLQIKTSIWHQFPYPVGEELVFRTKQSAVFACVMADFVKDFGTYLSVPLTL